MSGYFRFPTVAGETIVFTCEDDLWTVALSGGTARRLTAGLGESFRPRLSPDGAQVAFTGREEGSPDVYVMPAAGGPPRRLTYLGAMACLVAEWRDDTILFASDYGQPFSKCTTLWSVPVAGGEPTSLRLGSAIAISHGDGGRVALGRNTVDIARWKRYRGGTAGNIWVDPDGGGQWQRLVPRQDGQPIRGNVAAPMCVGDRIWFVSDHEGVGNIYSCGLDGVVRRHTHHDEVYARNPQTDGRTIVYHAGGVLYALDIASDTDRRVDVDLHSPRVQRNRKFVDVARHLETVALHPEGHSVAVVSRGQAFAMACWEGAVTGLTAPGTEYGAARVRLAEWLAGGSQIVAVTDAEGEEALVVHDAASGARVALYRDLDIGRVVELAVAPGSRQVALVNHRREVAVVDLDAGTRRVLDRSGCDPHFPTMGLSWSPDGRFLAYAFADTINTSVIKVAEVAAGATHTVTSRVLKDYAPCFDPDGRYLYFLSARVFNPVYDALDFDMNFPRGTRPYCIALRNDLPSPFVPVAKSLGEMRRERMAEMVGSPTGPKPPPEVNIHFDGIDRRIVAFPVPEDKYVQLAAAHGRVFYTTIPILEALGTSPPPKAPATLHAFDLRKLEQETVSTDVTSFVVAAGGDVLGILSDGKLRVIDVEAKKDEPPRKREGKAGAFDRESGWVDLSRIRVRVEPAAEWRQMYREAWRLQRDNFWTADMSGVDWRRVYDRYLPLLDRVSTRSEFSDLMWEMQGELGTSHCYEMGGDYRAEPAIAQGSLGAEYTWDAAVGAWRITSTVAGDSWEEGRDSPLHALGVNAKVGEHVVAIGGRRVSADVSPRQLLMNEGARDVNVTLSGAGGERTVVVKTLRSETPLRYRAWVDGNRRAVHDASGGRIGYVHVPNMMGLGMSEFFRGFLAEVVRDGLIVDVRYNGGGHTSQLILEKLMRRRIGYGTSRWGAPQPYFTNAVLGPIVGITNEFAGSDGDIFSHSFKLLGLGTLVGTRTWGGVVGIWPRHALADGAVTTQPEFSHWFVDTGWGVENYGTDPDVEVDIAPHDWHAGRDPQLERALAIAAEQMAKDPPKVPEFPQRPDLSLPTLPRRSR